MTILWINHATTARLVDALCNTLIHSLWQGILLAFVAGLIVINTRRSAATLRYNLLVSAFVLFALGVFATFVWQYQNTIGILAAPSMVHLPIHLEKNAVVVTALALAALPANHVSAIDRVSAFLNDHHNSIAFVWFLIICARALQFGFGLYGTHRLKSMGVAEVRNEWQEILQRMAVALDIKQTIRLLESGVAKVPMVFGHFKPVILVPIGLLTALSTGEVEAILAHELAHIKRRDYLVNMLQCMMEILFFFNPALLWVSKLIKTEREHCCDDLALAQNDNKLNYIRALVSCQEYQFKMPVYALSFSGRKKTLLRRVQRMVGNFNYSLNLLEKTVLAVCMVALGVGVSAFSGDEHNERKVSVKEETIRKENHKQERQSINNTKPGATQSQHTAPTLAINHHSRELHADNDTVPATPEANTFQLPGGDSSVIKSLRLLDPHPYNVMHDIGLELYHEGLVTDTNHLNITLNERELIVNNVKMPNELHERIYQQFDNKAANSNDGNRSYLSEYKPNDKNTSHKSEDREKSDRTDRTGLGDRDSLSEKNYHGDVYGYGASGSTYQKSSEERQRYWGEQQKRLVMDLLHDSLITDPKNVSFSISNENMMINGQKQSDEVYKKYKAKYMADSIGTGWSWSYSHHE